MQFPHFFAGGLPENETAPRERGRWFASTAMPHYAANNAFIFFIAFDSI